MSNKPDKCSTRSLTNQMLSNKPDIKLQPVVKQAGYKVMFNQLSSKPDKCSTRFQTNQRHLKNQIYLTLYVKADL